MENKILELVEYAYDQKRRLVAPLVGFPGLQLYETSIKIAQQNSLEHSKVLKAIYEKLHPDVMFPLMDLSVEANALGQYTVFPVDDSATVEQEVVYTADDIERLKHISLRADGRVRSYADTVSFMKKYFKPRVVGAYVSGPYTLAGLLIGASNAATYSILDPVFLHKVCELATEKISEYAQWLIEVGADILCVLEPSGVMLGPEQFQEFSARYIQKIHEYIGTSVPLVYHVCGNSMHIIPTMCNSGIQAISIDSQEAGVDIRLVAETIPRNVVIIGNLCPTGTILHGTVDEVKEETLRLLELLEPFPNFLLSTGCDLPKQVPVKNIEAFIEIGREYRRK